MVLSIHKIQASLIHKLAKSSIRHHFTQRVEINNVVDLLQFPVVVYNSSLQHVPAVIQQIFGSLKYWF